MPEAVAKRDWLMVFPWGVSLEVRLRIVISSAE
jgi:hypothetical protein